MQLTYKIEVLYTGDVRLTANYRNEPQNSISLICENNKIYIDFAVQILGKIIDAAPTSADKVELPATAIKSIKGLRAVTLSDAGLVDKHYDGNPVKLYNSYFIFELRVK